MNTSDNNFNKLYSELTTVTNELECLLNLHYDMDDLEPDDREEENRIIEVINCAKQLLRDVT